MRFFRNAADTANIADRQAIQELTADQAEQVGGGFPIAVIVIAVACALLLSHD